MSVHFGLARCVLLLVGCALLLHSAYLASVKVTHMGMVMPAMLGLAMVLLGVGMDTWNDWLLGAPWRMRAWKFVLVGFSIWFVSLMVFFGYLQASIHPGIGLRDPKVIVVLGSSTPGAHPSPALAERLKLAYSVARQYPDAKVIVSGGVDSGEGVSEARVMADYLIALGLDSKQILVEDKSTSTHENLLFSARVAQAQGTRQDAPMSLVSSDFHTRRAGWIAAKVGWTQVQTVGAPTPLYMRYNAWTREYFACLSGWLLREF